MPCDIKNPIFNDEDKAREALEAVRWPDGSVPSLRLGRRDRQGRGQEAVAPSGPVLLQRMQRSVHGHRRHRVRALQNPAHQVVAGGASARLVKKGISPTSFIALGVTYKTAWFMTHRIREAMRAGEPAPWAAAASRSRRDLFRSVEPAKRRTKTRSADPSPRPAHPARRTSAPCSPSSSAAATSACSTSPRRQVTVEKIVARQHRQGSHALHRRKPPLFRLSRHFAGHETVTHDHEYVRGDVHTNTVEGAFSSSSAA